MRKCDRRLLFEHKKCCTESVCPPLCAHNASWMQHNVINSEVSASQLHTKPSVAGCITILWGVGLKATRFHSGRGASCVVVTLQGAQSLLQACKCNMDASRCTDMQISQRAENNNGLAPLERAILRIYFLRESSKIRRIQVRRCANS